MKTLKFKDNLVSSILSQEKYVTWRFFDDKDLKIDDELIFINKDTDKEFAQAVIVGVREKKLGEIDESDFLGHEHFKNTEDMFQTYVSYYGDTINKESVTKIINFKLKL